MSLSIGFLCRRNIARTAFLRTRRLWKCMERTVDGWPASPCLISLRKKGLSHSCLYFVMLVTFFLYIFFIYEVNVECLLQCWVICCLPTCSQCHAALSLGPVEIQPPGYRSCHIYSVIATVTNIRGAFRYSAVLNVRVECIAQTAVHAQCRTDPRTHSSSPNFSETRWDILMCF